MGAEPFLSTYLQTCPQALVNVWGSNPQLLVPRAQHCIPFGYTQTFVPTDQYFFFSNFCAKLLNEETHGWDRRVKVKIIDHWLFEKKQLQKTGGIKKCVSLLDEKAILVIKETWPFKAGTCITVALQSRFHCSDIIRLVWTIPRRFLNKNLQMLKLLQNLNNANIN